MRIFLLGFMAAGKTLTGKRLTERLGYTFIDLDHAVEQKIQQNIKEIFAEKGEQYFREEESKRLRELSEYSDIVVACGGGTPCYGDNMAWINRHGKSVWLDCPADQLYARLNTERGSRPLLEAKTGAALRKKITELLAAREPYYAQAQYRIQGAQVDLEELLRSLGLS